MVDKENGGVHRCVVASITVKAPVREVWNILTDYERLPEYVGTFSIFIRLSIFQLLLVSQLIILSNYCRIVPNLAISKVLSRENNKVRILQVCFMIIVYFN